MELLPLKRKNQALREVKDDEGNIWTVNTHGVAYRKEADPHFDGWSVTVFPDELYPIVSVARSDKTFKRCKCC